MYCSRHVLPATTSHCTAGSAWKTVNSVQWDESWIQHQ